MSGNGRDDRPDTVSRMAPADVARLIVSARDLRDQALPEIRFADPAWDILIDIYLATASGRLLSVSDVGVGSRVPPTTALRWIEYLTGLGVIESVPDPGDRRRRHIRMAADQFERMESLFARIADSISSAEARS